MLTYVKVADAVGGLHIGTPTQVGLHRGLGGPVFLGRHDRFFPNDGKLLLLLPLVVAVVHWNGHVVVGCFLSGF